VSLIVDNNTQVPSRIKALIEKTGEDPGPILVDMAKRLEASGAEALAMPCNTAHHYAPAIQKAVEIPLLNMVELSVERVADIKLANKRVGLLASPAVKSIEIFDRAFSRLQIDTIYSREQDRLLEAIRAVKVDSGDRAAHLSMETAARELVENGADILLIACSELSIIAAAVPVSFPRLDTIDILAEEIVKFAGANLRNMDEGGATWHMSA
jgi:aspartate racemase